MMNNKILIGTLLGTMALTAIIMSYFMVNNMQKDTSKKRYHLTKDYKKFKKQKYNYDSSLGVRSFNQLCARCHGINGVGRSDVPPLAQAKILESHDKFLKVIIFGLKGKIQRNEITYNNKMPSFKNIGHQDLAHLANYVLKTFSPVLKDSKSIEQVTTVDIITHKVEGVDRSELYTEAEL